MAKIDTSKIEGYSEMTAEEKLAILEGYEIEETSDIESYKKMISKANSEAAEWKKKHNALLSDEEKAKEESNAKFQAMQDRLEELEKEKMVATYQASFTAMGYEEKSAKLIANHLADGKMNDVFAIMKQHNENREKELRAEILKNTPSPERGGASSSSISKEDFNKMSYTEKLEVFNTDPDLYKELTKK